MNIVQPLTLTSAYVEKFICIQLPPGRPPSLPLPSRVSPLLPVFPLTVAHMWDVLSSHFAPKMKKNLSPVTWVQKNEKNHHFSNVGVDQVPRETLNCEASSHPGLLCFVLQATPQLP